MLPFFLLLQISKAAELLFVFEFSIHGAEGPSKVYEFNQDYWPSYMLGELTGNGLRQHYLIGSEYRYRYIEQQAFMSFSYNPDDLYAESTYHTKSNMSAQAQGTGFFPDYTGPTIHIELNNRPPVDIENIEEIEKSLGEAALPDFAQVVPVYPITYDYKFLEPRFMDLCPRYKQLWESVIRSDTYLQKEKLYQQTLFKEINSSIGTDIQTIREANQLLQTIVMDIYEEMPIQLQFNNELFDNLYELSLNYYKEEPLIKQEAQRLACSGFFTNLQDQISLAQDGTNYKFIMSVGTIEMMVAYLTCLGHDISLLPVYSSVLLFEYYDDNQLYIYYNDKLIGVNDSEKPLSYDLFSEVMAPITNLDVFKCSINT